MTKAVEVITSVQRRRRWSRAEKERIVAAALEPGAVAGAQVGTAPNMNKYLPT
jgi:transposase-like protein